MLRIYYLICILFFFINCKKSSNSSKLSTVNNQDTITVLDTEAKSYTEVQKSRYSKDDFNFILKDREDINLLSNGILVLKSDYLPNYNDIGNVLFYFFSKSGAWQWKEKIDNFSEEESEKELERIKKLPLEKFVKEFEVYAFIIDKKYIQDTPEGPYQKEAYVKELYYRNDKDIWEKIESFEVKKQEDFTKEREWSKRKLA